MTAIRSAVSQPPSPMTGEPDAAPTHSESYLLRLSDGQAREPIPFLPGWLDRVRNSGARRVVIDMSDVSRLDLSGFGVVLAKLRDVLGVTVLIRDLGVSERVSLQSMGLLEGAIIERSRDR